MHAYVAVTTTAPVIWEPKANNTRFSVRRDGDVWCVGDTSQYGQAQMLIPADHKSEFETKDMALEQCRRLTAHQAKGNKIRMQLRYTYENFEAVADTIYGPAW